MKYEQQKTARERAVQGVKKVWGAGASGPCRVWAEPTNLTPQRFHASTASTAGARCATLIVRYGFFDSLNRPRTGGCIPTVKAIDSDQLFCVKLVWQRLQVMVTTPLPRFRRSHALQPGHLKYL